MIYFPPTIILRHRRENLKKCSLRGLEKRPDLIFLTYPLAHLPNLDNACILALDAPLLVEQDNTRALFLIDGTWKHAQTMAKLIPPRGNYIYRSLPPHFQTAYPRRQLDCPDPKRGLASVEALYLAYLILGRSTVGLLDYYYWKEDFLTNKILNLRAHIS